MESYARQLELSTGVRAISHLAAVRRIITLALAHSCTEHRPLPTPGNFRPQLNTRPSPSPSPHVQRRAPDALRTLDDRASDETAQTPEIALDRLRRQLHEQSMSAPTKPKQAPKGWGSFLQGAVAGLESRLDTILAEDDQSSARTRADDAVRRKVAADQGTALFPT